MTEAQKKLLQFICKKNISEIKKLLSTNPELVNTSFVLAITYSDNPQIITELLNAGANIDIQDDKGRTPLFYSLIKGEKIAITNMLFDSGANPNIPDNEGITPLCWAAMHTKSQLIIQLLDAGATFEDSLTFDNILKMYSSHLYAAKTRATNSDLLNSVYSGFDINTVFSKCDIKYLDKILNFFDNNPKDFSSDQEHDLLKVFFDNFNLDFPSYNELQDFLNKPKHLNHVKEALKDLDPNVAKAFLYEFDNGFYNTCNITREQFINTFAYNNLSKAIKFAPEAKKWSVQDEHTNVKEAIFATLKIPALLNEIFSYLEYADFKKIINDYPIETENVKSDAINLEPSYPYNEVTKTDLVGDYPPHNTDLL